MIKKKIAIGFLVGIAANLAGMFLYISLVIQQDFEFVLEKASAEGVLGSIIALGAILNFLPFFVFIKKKQDYRARGVLMATILSAIIILISKFL
jgi:ABC-type cobalamin transport system permease subunit